MKKQQLYFKNEDSEIAYDLQTHIEEAKEHGLKEIELYEAVPDKTNKDMIWCMELEDVCEKSECNKNCPYYKAPEKGKICQLRGRLMEWGEKVKFNIDPLVRLR